MGVPAFFRWISRKYPKIVSQVIDNDEVDVNGVRIPEPYSNPNPNGELDNLYLDMNGIVHPCTHPEGREPPKNEDEMMLEVFKYTDHVISMARPRKLLMIAVDGVAPRAKMNQQRSRRFRSAREARINSETKEAAIQEAEARGEIIDDAIKNKTQWDSNSITPGTPFMDLLAQSLRYWISYKLSTDEGWKDLKVIISDASVPGEGEHKLMEFIRTQRADPSYDPNTTHCIYGLDADLIFLGLATHEPHFKILREDVFAQSEKKERKPAGFGLTKEDQERIEAEEKFEKQKKKPFIWLHVDILRQYLEIELAVPRLPFHYDFERALDDWVFMCFFCGNDFLPHLPCLEVRSNSVDILTDMWRRNLAQMGGFMTCDGDVNLERAEIFLKVLANQEDNIYRSRLRQEEERKRRHIERESKPKFDASHIEDALIRPAEESKTVNSSPSLPNIPEPTVIPLSKSRSGDRAPINPLDNIPLYTPSGESVGAVHMTNSELVANRNKITMANIANKTAAEALKSSLKKSKTTKVTVTKVNQETTAPIADSIEAVLPSDDEKNEDEDDDDDTPTEDSTLNSPIMAGQKRTIDGTPKSATSEIREDMDQYADPIRFGEPGYRDRYYTLKFDAPESNPERRRDIVEKYMEGVCWVLKYYYQGCASWDWYFPYHYAPLAADFVRLKDIKIDFDEGTPILPYEQLMSVMPAASSHTLPPQFHRLMSSPDSEIIDFYPEDFVIDLNGKKFEWQGVAILPFIDKSRLLDAVQKVYPDLSQAERDRNTRKNEVLLISRHNVLFEQAKSKIYSDESEGDKTLFGVRCFESGGLSGIISKDPYFDIKSLIKYPLKEGYMPDIDPSTSVLSLTYDMPPLLNKNKSMLLPGVKLRPPVFTPSEEAVIKTKITERRRGGRNENNNAMHGNNALGRNEHLKVSGFQGGYVNFVESEKTGQLPGSDLQTRQGFNGNFNSGGSGRSNYYDNRNNYNNNNNYRNNYNNNGGHYNNRNRPDGGYQQGGYNNNRNNYNNNYNNYNNNRNSGNYYNNRDSHSNYDQGSYNNNRGYNNSRQSNYNNNRPPQGGYNNNYQSQQQQSLNPAMPFGTNMFGHVGNTPNNNNNNNSNNRYNNSNSGNYNNNYRRNNYN